MVNRRGKDDVCWQNRHLRLTGLSERLGGLRRKQRSIEKLRLSLVTLGHRQSVGVEYHLSAVQDSDSRRLVRTLTVVQYM